MAAETSTTAVTREEDIALAGQLLEDLPPVERLAVARFYRGRGNPAQVEAGLGLPPGRLAEIRMELSKRFFAALAARNGLRQIMEGQGETGG